MGSRMTLSIEGYLYQIGYVMSIFAMYPMVEGGDGITSAMDRFGPFFRVSTSIGLYSVDLRSEGVRGSSSIGRYRGRCLPWLVVERRVGAQKKI